MINSTLFVLQDDRHVSWGCVEQLGLVYILHVYLKKRVVDLSLSHFKHFQAC